jgi:lysophospholipase L1-like esterase
MCMDEGIYIISPDWYFASGVRKMPMGYKESNWTLPRAQQTLVARQNIYDGTWWRTPSMSYHALPLTPVYGGGPESTMEPLSQHLDQYDRVLGQYFGMGIMACYRGTRLYDTDKTKAVVTGWIDFYHRHEPILLSPIVHVRRPDGRDLDCMMHVNAALPEKGLAFVWNPTDKPIIRAVQLPLYYTGIAHEAEISVHAESSDEVQPKVYELDREYGVKVLVTVPARGYVWLLIKDATPTQAGRAAAFIERLQAGESQTIVTMGTSLTGGGSRWVTPFAGWLKSEFGDRAKVVNLGVGASASERYLPGRAGLDVLPVAIQHNPDVVIIEFATNDAYGPYEISVGRSRENLNTMIDRILDNDAKTQVILMTMNPVLDVATKQTTAATDRARLAEYFKGYRQVARERGLLLIDHYPNWLKLMNDDRDKFLEYVPDGIHPTQAGYHAIALPEIQRRLLSENGRSQ